MKIRPLVSKSKSILEKYLPPQTIEMLMPLLRSEPIELKVKPPRKTKFGDYRFPDRHGRHRISVNSNLNPYAFLITLLHEIAHLKAFKVYGKAIKPHGAEWQKTFSDICKPFIQANIFPDEIKHSLLASLRKGSASSCTDLELFRSLKSYDHKPALHLEDIQKDEVFCLDSRQGKPQSKMIFKKGEKARKRYKCVNLQNGREYMIHPLAEVKIVEPKNINKSA